MFVCMKAYLNVHVCLTVLHKFPAALHLPLAICSSSPEAQTTHQQPSLSLSFHAFFFTLFHALLKDSTHVMLLL